MNSFKCIGQKQTQYNLWANSLFCDWLQTSPRFILQKDLNSSVRSIDFTIQHFFRTQFFWLAFLTSQNINSFDWSVKNGNPHNHLKKLHIQSKQLVEAVVKLSDNDMLEILNSHLTMAKNKQPRFEYIFHVVNHSTFHRGQVITMTRELGIAKNIPVSDYNIFNTL